MNVWYFQHRISRQGGLFILYVGLFHNQKLQIHQLSLVEIERKNAAKLQEVNGRCKSRATVCDGLEKFLVYGIVDIPLVSQVDDKNIGVDKN